MSESELHVESPRLNTVSELPWRYYVAHEVLLCTRQTPSPLPKSANSPRRDWRVESDESENVQPKHSSTLLNKSLQCSYRIRQQLVEALRPLERVFRQEQLLQVRYVDFAVAKVRKAIIGEQFEDFRLRLLPYTNVDIEAVR